MFDLVIGSVDRPFRERSVGSKIVSVAGHAIVFLALMGISLLSTHELPRVQPMMAFVVAEAPSAPAPPPPPPPAVPRTAVPRPSTSTPRSPTPGIVVAPAEAPTELRAEKELDAETDFGVNGGLAGGVAGDIVGGMAGGIVGGLLPAEPPPPPASAPPAPVRIGGRLTAPKLLVQVQPTYPPLAVSAQVTGIVILEATVGADGCVQSVRVLQSNPLLEKAAVEAVKQWQYAPVMLNGVPIPFILTVTVRFSTHKSAFDQSAQSLIVQRGDRDS